MVRQLPFFEKKLSLYLPMNLDEVYDNVAKTERVAQRFENNKRQGFFFSSKATDLCDTDHLPKMVKSKIILSPGPHIYRYF